MYPPNYPDPSEINRFPASVSMGYYPPSEHSLPASSTFGGSMAEQNKYGRVGTDGTATVTSQQQQQQPHPQQQHPQQHQQQQASGTGMQQGQHLTTHFMNYSPYGFYSPMYHMPAGFSAAHNVR